MDVIFAKGKWLNWGSIGPRLLMVNRSLYPTCMEWANALSSNYKHILVAKGNLVAKILPCNPVTKGLVCN